MKIDRRISSAHQVYDSLRRRIMECDMEPGSNISKGAIAEEFGISPGPVRDALLRLEAEGLVDIVPQSKTMVSLIDIQDAREVHFLRLSVEVEVVRVLAAIIDQAKLETLRSWIDRHVIELNSGDTAAFKRMDHSFHTEMFRFAGVEGLTTLIGTRRGHYDRIRGLYLVDHKRREIVIKEHRAIVDALAAGDAVAAERGVRTHLGKSLAVIDEIRRDHEHYFL